MLVAAGAIGATGTFAWFAASGNPSATAAAGSPASVGSIKSDVTVAGYTITVTPAAINNLQLTNAVAVSTKYKLQYGGVTGGKAVVADCESGSGFVAEITGWTATWSGGAPSQAEDIDYFKNKRLIGGVLKPLNKLSLCRQMQLLTFLRRAELMEHITSIYPIPMPWS